MFTKSYYSVLQIFFNESKLKKKKFHKAADFVSDVIYARLPSNFSAIPPFPLSKYEYITKLAHSIGRIYIQQECYQVDAQKHDSCL